MSTLSRSKRLSRLAAAACLFVGGVVLLSGLTTPPEPLASADSQYIGATKCKNCHKDDALGNQFAAWENGPHSKAFETLASDAAKKIAAERGIEDPQKADECLRCHTTAFGADKKQIKRGFKTELGVQCESCHGPGGDHSKARFAAAMEENPVHVIEDGEIVSLPPQETCLQCHNSDSPTFEKFCYYERVAEVRHLRPKSPEELAEILVCGCDECACSEGCPDDGCGVPQGLK